MIQPQLQHSILGSLQLLDACFQLKEANQLQVAELRGTGHMEYMTLGERMGGGCCGRERGAEVPEPVAQSEADTAVLRHG